jgi:hypothetical protein
MREVTGCERALLVSGRQGIRLLGGAVRVWGRCLAAGRIRPAVRVGSIQYHRYGDIAALAERLCREQPPDWIAMGREEANQRSSGASLPSGGSVSRRKVGRTVHIGGVRGEGGRGREVRSEATA